MVAHTSKGWQIFCDKPGVYSFPAGTLVCIGGKWETLLVDHRYTKKRFWNNITQAHEFEAELQPLAPVSEPEQRRAL